MATSTMARPHAAHLGEIFRPEDRDSIDTEITTVISSLRPVTQEELLRSQREIEEKLKDYASTLDSTIERVCKERNGSCARLAENPIIEQAKAYLGSDAVSRYRRRDRQGKQLETVEALLNAYGLIEGIYCSPWMESVKKYKQVRDSEFISEETRESIAKYFAGSVISHLDSLTGKLKYGKTSPDLQTVKEILSAVRAILIDKLFPQETISMICASGRVLQTTYNMCIKRIQTQTPPSTAQQQPYHG